MADDFPKLRLPRALTWLFSGGAIIIIVALVLLVPLWVWYGWRIEPGPTQVAVLVHKTGTDLSSGQILASTPDQKGIQADVLPPGRYFRNPYSWGWRYTSILDIPAGKLGVQIRLYGNDLPSGEVLATDTGTKGVLREVLGPGKHYVNPYAYKVVLVDAISVRPGHVAVQTSMVGKDPLAHADAGNGITGFIAQPNMKGVIPEVLDPGTYYLNPYLVTTVEVNLQSQRFELSGDDAINFLTQDGFTVVVEGTIEFALQRDQVPLLTHRVGDMNDILQKIILPRARGFSRLEGSKNPAINYIVGETRQQFQDTLETHLRAQCQEWGVDIKSVLIRNISPPDEIASIIRDREVAVQDARKFTQQIEQARSKAELTRQEMLAIQNKEKVTSETAKLRAMIQVQQDQAVQLKAASQALEVAKLEGQAAAAKAEAIRLKAAAEQDVIRLGNEAEVGVLASKIKAFGSGQALARYELQQKLAPRLGSILANDQADGLGGLFQQFLGTPATGTVASDGPTGPGPTVRKPEVKP
jgi:regulator of protease activity HflC (stomatin/prohibitin superfamily)